MKLSIGDPAPPFSVPDQDGRIITLSSLKGKKVVLYFYPHDMTPGCTTEACNLRDNYKALIKQGYFVLGVSTDDEKSHRKFIKKENLPFSLLSDTEKEMHHAYGTGVEKSMYGRKYMGTARVTFVLNEKGKIVELFEKVDTANHASQILQSDTHAGASTTSKSKKVSGVVARSEKKKPSKKSSGSKKPASKKLSSRRKS
jgi:peroxiredoxin Q/BCP